MLETPETHVLDQNETNTFIGTKWSKFERSQKMADEDTKSGSARTEPTPPRARSASMSEEEARTLLRRLLSSNVETERQQIRGW